MSPVSGEDLVPKPSLEAKEVEGQRGTNVRRGGRVGGSCRLDTAGGNWRLHVGGDGLAAHDGPGADVLAARRSATDRSRHFQPPSDRPAAVRAAAATAAADVLAPVRLDAAAAEHAALHLRPAQVLGERRAEAVLRPVRLLSTLHPTAFRVQRLLAHAHVEVVCHCPACFTRASSN